MFYILHEKKSMIRDAVMKLSAKQYVGSFGSYFWWYIISMGDAASVIPLEKIPSPVTIDGAVIENTVELSAQVAVRLGHSHDKCTSWRASL
jgi:hypothetical protein